MSSREEWYSAIFAIIAPIASTFKTVSRRLALVETIDPNAMPAFFQQQLTEPVPQSSLSFDGVEFNTLNLCWYIYAYQGNEALPTTPVLNPLVDAVLTQLNTIIGGQASNPVFVGEHRLSIIPTGVTYWEGVLGDRAVCRIDLVAKPVIIE